MTPTRPADSLNPLDLPLPPSAGPTPTPPIADTRRRELPQRSPVGAASAAVFPPPSATRTRPHPSPSRTPPLLLALLLSVPFTSPAPAQFTPPPSPTTNPSDPDAAYTALRDRIARARADAAALDEKNTLRYAADSNYFLRPGLLADRKNRVVTLSAYATGLSGNDPIEFFLISPTSGKAYESLAVSFAKPSDLREALIFLGMSPGRPVNYARNRFVPKGEHVRMTFNWDIPAPDGTSSRASARVEDLLLLRNPDGTPSDRTLPHVGLVFTGGTFMDGENPTDPPRFLADIGDPGSIASNYNEPTTVLDFPAFARQSEVYRSRIINPAHPLTPGQPLTIQLEPDRSPTDPPRVLDLIVTVSPPPTPPPAGTPPASSVELKSLTYSLSSPTPVPNLPLPQSASTADLLTALTQLIDSGREPFVTVLPSPDLPLSTVRQLYAFLSALQTDNGIRLEPPSPPSATPTAPPSSPATPTDPATPPPSSPATAAHPFFESFLPDENLRDPAKRLWQPIELRLSADGRMSLRDYKENDLTAPGQPRFTTTDTPVPTPADLLTLLAARQDQRRPLALYAPAKLPYQSLLHWTSPTLTQSWTLWIYLEP